MFFSYSIRSSDFGNSNKRYVAKNLGEILKGFVTVEI